MAYKNTAKERTFEVRAKRWKGQTALGNIKLPEEIAQAAGVKSLSWKEKPIIIVESLKGLIDSEKYEIKEVN